MEQQEILNKINQIKNNVQHLFHDVSDVVLERLHKLTESDDTIHPIHIDNYQYESHYPDDDLPLTLAKDPEPGVHYYDTENSPMSVGKPKMAARGIDKFDDEDEDEVLEEDIRRAGNKRKAPVKKTAARKAPAKKRRTIH